MLGIDLLLDQRRYGICPGARGVQVTHIEYPQGVSGTLIALTGGPVEQSQTAGKGGSGQ